ncbi:MAG TPA: peptidylprolyl isomerase [Gemmatimonadales bacterium]|nr:peptidylprolyl isomerase [Gemmatimonadales bacterium]
MSTSMELGRLRFVVPRSLPGRMSMPSRARLLALLLALLLHAHRAAGQSEATGSPVSVAVDTAALDRLLVAEDERGTGRAGLQPLLVALDGADTLLRRVAVRGIGRLQRPELGLRLVPYLADPLPAIRAETANAIAQSMRRVRRAEKDSTRSMADRAAAELVRRLATESDPTVVDALAQSLGRLPLPDSAAARAAENAIRGRLTLQVTPGLVHGLYTLARVRRATGNVTPATVALLRSAAVGAPDTLVRRLALLTLAAADGLDSVTATRAARDPDDETRRMALRGTRVLAAPLRAELVRRASSDPSAIVRLEAIAAARLGEGLPDCTTILAATRDRDPYVILTAIDSLGGGCADRAATVDALRRLVSRPPKRGPPDHLWQAGAHALLSLARLDTAAAVTLLPGLTGSPRAAARIYAARSAAATGERSTLLRLAADADRNVQEAAITGLAAVAGHEADSIYVAALGSSGHQVSLAAATALKGSAYPGALPALLDAFDSLSARRSENARDPRVAMLERIGELGSSTTAPRLQPYLADYDTTVATLAAATLSRWTGEPVTARPAPLPIRAESLGSVFLRRTVRLRVMMAPSSGGGSFTVRLLPGETPATVARVLRLVRERFYDGKVFQRVEPNFVIQGGGPDANEYVGDATFMRDELALRTHARGTVGISARGRDTGDGQWFVNLADNPLLDHEFTIFGRIDGGRAVAERILEWDQIARVEIVEER